jgi:hypothetical protein
MKSTKPGMEIEVARGSVVPSGRTGYLEGFPGTSSLANLRGRFATSNQDVEVGKGGNQDAQKWEKAAQNGVFFPDEECFSRLFAAFPGISHLFPHQFFSRAKIQQGVRRRTFGAKVTRKFGLFHEGWLPKPATRWVPQWSCSLARNVVATFHESSHRSGP